MIPLARAACGVAVAAAFAAPSALADAIYHSQHLDLHPVAAAPLRSGFVENVHANGPVNYAHERTVLNGALPGTTFTVVGLLYGPGDTACTTLVGPFPRGELTTNGAGNGELGTDVKTRDFPGLVGTFGFRFAVVVGADPAGPVAYETDCSSVTFS